MFYKDMWIAILLSAGTLGLIWAALAQKIQMKPFVVIILVLMIADPLTSTGFIHPGDKVDILAQMDFPGKGNTTFTILENIKLIAVGKDVDQKKGSEGTKVSFFVTPEEMERLRFAQREGKFFISLRNPLDQEKGQVSKGVNMDTFLLMDRVYESAEQKVKIKSRNEKKKKR